MSVIDLMLTRSLIKVTLIIYATIMARRVVVQITHLLVATGLLLVTLQQLVITMVTKATNKQDDRYCC